MFNLHLYANTGSRYSIKLEMYVITIIKLVYLSLTIKSHEGLHVCVYIYIYVSIYKLNLQFTSWRGTNFPRNFIRGN